MNLLSFATFITSLFLIGVHSDRVDQEDFLIQTKGMTKKEAETLIDRDQIENLPHGQHLVDTFHMSNFFVRLTDKPKELRDGYALVIDDSVGAGSYGWSTPHSGHL